MPANQKTFTEIKREKFNAFRQSLRENAWVPPYSDSGALRGTDGLFADMQYDEPTGVVSFRIRELGKGQTYASFFDKVENILKGITT